MASQDKIMRPESDSPEHICYFALRMNFAWPEVIEAKEGRTAVAGRAGMGDVYFRDGAFIERFTTSRAKVRHEGRVFACKFRAHFGPPNEIKLHLVNYDEGYALIAEYKEEPGQEHWNYDLHFIL